MAGEDTHAGEPATDTEDPAAASHEPRECMPCRGTGRVISNLGGSPTTVACPWCNGSGVRVPDIDAQAHWRGQGDDAGAGEPRADPPAAGENPA